MTPDAPMFLFRRAAALGIDIAFELICAVLGSYFGAMIAALFTVVSESSPQQLESSMFSGFALGFVFWGMAMSFLNRVVIQSFWRATLGKRLFQLEVTTLGGSLGFHALSLRWIASAISMATFGLGYGVALFRQDGRTFHDVVAGTDCVPIIDTVQLEVRTDAQTSSQIPAVPSLAQIVSETLVLSSHHAERPLATVIQLRKEITPATEIHPSLEAESQAAKVIVLHPETEDKKVA